MGCLLIFSAANFDQELLHTVHHQTNALLAGSIRQQVAGESFQKIAIR